MKDCDHVAFWNYENCAECRRLRDQFFEMAKTMGAAGRKVVNKILRDNP